MDDSDGPVLLVDRSEELLTLTLNRPASGNALSPSLVEAMLVELANPGQPRLCVIKGSGKLFCGGFDLSDLDGDDMPSDGDLPWRFVRIEQLLQAVHYAPFPARPLGR